MDVGVSREYTLYLSQSPRNVVGEGMIHKCLYEILYTSQKNTFELNQLGSVAGPVIQANGRLSFDDDLRSGGLLYCVSQ